MHCMYLLIQIRKDERVLRGAMVEKRAQNARVAPCARRACHGRNHEHRPAERIACCCMCLVIQKNLNTRIRAKGLLNMLHREQHSQLARRHLACDGVHQRAPSQAVNGVCTRTLPQEQLKRGGISNCSSSDQRAVKDSLEIGSVGDLHMAQQGAGD